MLDIEIMKWGCGLAAGFEMYESGLHTFRINTPEGGIIINTCSIWDYVYYPLFLQRVIEGITEKYGFQFDAYFNKDSKQWNYMFFNKMDIQYPESKGLLPHTNNVIDGDIIDQAKEQAIKYIHNHLTKHEI